MPFAPHAHVWTAGDKALPLGTGELEHGTYQTVGNPLPAQPRRHERVINIPDSRLRLRKRNLGQQLSAGISGYESLTLANKVQSIHLFFSSLRPRWTDLKV